MIKLTKILAGVAVAGIVAVGGSAFTATGLTTTGQADAAQFVGGTISQSVTGASLSTIAYSYSDGAAKTTISGVTLTFTDGVEGLTVSAVGTGGTPVAFVCETLGDTTPNVSTCTNAGYEGLTSLAVTVS